MNGFRKSFFFSLPTKVVRARIHNVDFCGIIPYMFDFSVCIKHPNDCTTAACVKTISFRKFRTAYGAVLEFDYDIADTNIRSVLDTVFFHNDFLTFFREMILPFAVPFTHFVFPSVRTNTVFFVGEISVDAFRVFCFKNDRSIAHRTKILFSYSGFACAYAFSVCIVCNYHYLSLLSLMFVLGNMIFYTCIIIQRFAFVDIFREIFCWKMNKKHR